VEKGGVIVWDGVGEKVALDERPAHEDVFRVEAEDIDPKSPIY
jgi:hypothetical protein